MSMDFVIIICAILLAQIVTLVLSLTCLQFVKAGDVGEKCHKYTVVSKQHIKKLLVDGKYISTDKLKKYIVHGNSMSPYGVKDGNLVYVMPSDSSALESEKRYPIVLFEYDVDSKYDCDIKLRKFLEFIDINNIDINTLYKQYGSKHVSLEQFTDDIQDRILKIKEDENDTSGQKYILSVTYLYKKLPATYHYSIHNANKVRGIVKYVA